MSVPVSQMLQWSRPVGSRMTDGQVTLPVFAPPLQWSRPIVGRMTRLPAADRRLRVLAAMERFDGRITSLGFPAIGVPRVAAMEPAAERLDDQVREPHPRLLVEAAMEPAVELIGRMTATAAQPDLLPERPQ
jgi:hypothetical protein